MLPGHYRLEIATGSIERVGAHVSCWPYGYSYHRRAILAGQDESVAVFPAAGDCIGENPDLNYEIFLIDMNAPARIRVSAGTEPTVVSWDHEPGPIHYDVIRGNLENLNLPGNGTVDLGPVSCLENDTADNDTYGAEDALQPGPGEALFYLYRGYQDLPVDNGTYGRASSGEERMPGGGGCED